MKARNRRKILIALLLALMMMLSITMGVFSIAEADRPVNMTGSNFFYANDGAKIYSYENFEPNDSSSDEDVDGDVDDDEDEDETASEGSDSTGSTSSNSSDWSKTDVVMFYMGDEDDNVTYRYNLAYHWFAAENDEDNADLSCSDTGDYSSGVEGWFSMVIGFNPSFINETCNNFETFTIMFQSQQYARTEDSVTTNYITFVNNGLPGDDAGVYVIITDDEEETEKTAEDFNPDTDTLLHITNGKQTTGIVDNDVKAAKITIAFTGYSETVDGEDHTGEYSVKVSSDAGEETDENGDVAGNNEVVTGYFKNVGGSYSKRVNSTSAGVMPLTFSATFPKDGTDAEVDPDGDGGNEGVEDYSINKYASVGDKDNECGMILFSLNGQSFNYIDASETDNIYKNGEDKIISGSQVDDNTPPVLCVDNGFSYLKYGETLSFDYTAVDVLASSPKTEIKYYVLSGEQYEDETLNYNRVSDEETDSDDPSDEEIAALEKSPFTLSTDDNRLLIETGIPYLPEDILTSNKTATSEGGSGCTVNCLAKVCVELTDITSSSGNNKTTTVMLDWYLDNDDVVTIHEGEDNEANFIKVISDSKGATYGYFTDEDGARYSYNEVVYGEEEISSYNYVAYDAALKEAYQAKVDELAMDGEEYLLNAGSSSYFYLPAYNGFINDNVDSYENLTFSVYYDVDGVQGSNTGLSYDTMTISLSSVGVYTFTVYATDASTNQMYYMAVTEDQDGNNVYELKEFQGSDIYDDDDIMDALPWFTFKVVYRGATIEDVEAPSAGFVGTTYTDISFDINGISSYYDTYYNLYLFDVESYMFDYNLDYYDYDNFFDDVQELFETAQTRIYFHEIPAYADLNENDEDYDDWCDYEWDPDELSFVPQDSDAFYVVRLTLEDTYNHLEDSYSYLAIHVSVEGSEFRGETEWIKNNLVSFILFIIAGVALIGIVLVFVIRPKDSGDVDVQLAKKAEKVKAKTEKKSKK